METGSSQAPKSPLTLLPPARTAGLVFSVSVCHCFSCKYHLVLLLYVMLLFPRGSAEKRNPFWESFRKEPPSAWLPPAAAGAFPGATSSEKQRGPGATHGDWDSECLWAQLRFRFQQQGALTAQDGQGDSKASGLSLIWMVLCSDSKLPC